jgi:hypothetical protein
MQPGGSACIAWPALLLATALAARAEPAAPPLQNWFDEPFFRVSAAIADCPEPAGPFTDAADRRLQAHRRAEKGTTCWLAGECDRPNAYAYDADIAAAIRAAMSGPQAQAFAASSSLWVTVQGRVVYLEGCIRAPTTAAALEAFVRALPHVQQASAIVREGAAGAVPYRRR